MASKRKPSAAASDGAMIGSFLLRRHKAKKGEMLAEARAFRRKPRIHTRRIIPKAAVGATRGDKKPTRALSLFAPRSMALALGQPQPKATTDALEIARNTALGNAADHGTASNVCEPSLAANGTTVFYTGNWFASLSKNGGASFQWIDPYHTFPDPAGMQFCCDQIAHYVPSIDMFVWLLQYSEASNGENIQRLAFGKTADVRNGQWQYFDITPADVGLVGEFLDYPDLAVGKNRLYVTFNSFAGDTWTTSVIVRIPLSGLQSGNPTATFYKSTTHFNFRVAQDCGTTAYFAAQTDTSTLRVWRWRESAATPTWKDVPVASFKNNSYVSNTPDGRNWLGRADERLTGAARKGTELWFCWGAAKGGANARPRPYVQIARIRSSTLTLIENINVWDPVSATCYGALIANSNGEMGLTYTIGGGGRFPSMVVAVLTGTRRDVVAMAGTRGPSDDQWGDYMTIRRDHPDGKLFVAAGHTLQPGGGQADATPQFVRFGRASDV